MFQLLTDRLSKSIKLLPLSLRYPSSDGTWALWRSNKRIQLFLTKLNIKYFRRLQNEFKNILARLQTYFKFIRIVFSYSCSRESIPSYLHSTVMPRTGAVSWEEKFNNVFIYRIYISLLLVPEVIFVPQVVLRIRIRAILPFKNRICNPASWIRIGTFYSYYSPGSNFCLEIIITGNRRSFRFWDTNAMGLWYIFHLSKTIFPFSL